MSIIDNINHNVVTYVSGTTKPFTGQRLSTHNWKTVTDKNSPLCGIKRESKAISLPVVTSDEVTQNLPLLMPHFIDLIHSVQDKIIKAKLESDNHVLSIASADISITQVLEYLDDSNESGRLTKEVVGKWFDDVILAPLAATLAERLGISEVPTDAENAKVMATVAKFKEDIAALAGGKTKYSPVIAKHLAKAVEMAPEGDTLAVKFGIRLAKMQEATEYDLYSALS